MTAENPAVELAALRERNKQLQEALAASRRNTVIVIIVAAIVITYVRLISPS